jgi:glycosyltransferase involved in cell wall biosynthesis
MKARIALVTNRFVPFVGGVERYVERLASAFRFKGFEVQIITVLPAQNRFVEVSNDGVLRFVGMSPILPDVSVGVALHLLFSGDSRYDLLVVNGYHTLLSFEMAMLSKARMVFVPHFHGLVGRTNLRTALHRPYRFFGSLISSRAAKIVCASRYEERLFLGYFPASAGKTVVIREGVDSPINVAVERRRNTLLTVCRLEAYKEVQSLVRALPYLQQYTLHIVGEGPFKRTLQALAQRAGVSSRVVFHGLVSEEEKNGLYLSSSVFALLSSEEAYGLAVGEALAAGLPAVVPTFGALSEWIDGSNCIGVENPADPRMLADAVRTLEGRTAKVRLPTWEEYADRFVELALAPALNT